MNERIVMTEGAVHEFRFHPEAMEKRHSVNYSENEDLRLHVGVQEADGYYRFVANDRIGNVWGKALILPISQKGGSIAVTVCFEEEQISLQINDDEPVAFRSGNILPEQLRVRYTRAIEFSGDRAPDDSGGMLQAASDVRERISQLVPGTAQGFVEFQAFVPEADLWIVAGWVREIQLEQELEGSKPVLTFLFPDTEITRSSTICWNERPDLNGAGVGFLLVMRQRPAPAAQLLGAEFVLGSHRQISMLSTGAPPVSDAVKLQWARDILGRSHGREVALAERLLDQIYAGHETLTQLEIYVELDEAIHVPGQGILLLGWMVDPHDDVVSMRVRSGQVISGNALDHWQPISRADVMDSFAKTYALSDSRVGFLAFAPILCDADDDLYLEIGLRGDQVGFKPMVRRRLSGTAAIKRILGATSLSFDELDHAFDAVIGAPVIALNRARLDRPMDIGEISFGAEIERPRCSVIVPLYGRLDFMMYQQALFLPETMADDEFIYILDQPERKQEMFALAHSVHERFKQPFRILLPSENRGFGPASNLGLAVARGDFICFLNSDVFPDSQDWLTHLVNDLDADPSVGVAGGRLLFADGSIQHDGMVFEPIPQFGNWPFPIHPAKGMRPIERAHPVREAEAVTGACMVMRRNVAEQLGGFDRDYVIGDFEDADLCQRIKQQGLRCVVDDRATLFHLERQSQGDQTEHWRINLTLLNAWTFGRRWNRTGSLSGGSA